VVGLARVLGLATETFAADEGGDEGTLASAPIDATRPVVYLHGASRAVRRDAALAAVGAIGRASLVVDLAGLLGAGKSQLMGLVGREALLHDAVLCLDRFDALLTEEPELAPARTAVQRALTAHPGPVVLLGDLRWEPVSWFPAAACLRLEMPRVSLASRLAVWQRHFAEAVSADALAELAARYRLDDEQVATALAAAQLRATWRGADGLDGRDVREAASAIATPPLEGLARRIEPRYGWDDIILPADGLAQLRELCARARHQLTVLDRWGFGRKHARRAGLTALFVGQPGTGKTMAAEIVAGALGLELFRIDLSAVVSKYIGETEKNLERIFRAADRGDAVLLFDEADALFGKRSDTRDAHDRYANVEIAYLLQRLETYDGVAVLTTNLRNNLDEAFVRRLDFALEFPLPEEPERLKIWRLSLPAEAPLADDVDLPFLARKFRLAGGHIRNIALTAAFLAAEDGGAIGMKHLVRATKREYQKIGKLVAESDFERYFRLL
jgi:hypothetical protein